MRINTYTYLLYPVLLALSLAWCVSGLLDMRTSADFSPSLNIKTTKTAKKDTAPDINMILAENIFGAQKTSEVIASVETGETNESSAQAPSGFEGVLHGVVLSDEQTLAVFSTDGKEYVLRLDEEKDGITLVDVGYYHAVISRGGVQYRMVLKSDGDSQKKAGASTVKIHDTASTSENFKISRKEVVEQLSDVNNVIKSVLIVPFEIDGNFMGYRVRRMTNTSILNKIGVERNDIIMRLNGKSLDSPAVFFDALKNAENLSSISLDIMRAGKKSTIYVEIEG